MNPQALDHIVLDRITAGRDPAPNTGQAHASSSSTDNHSEAASIILRLVQDLKQVLLDYENDRRHLQNLKIHLAQNEQLATFLTHQALINAHRIAQIEQLLENGPVTGEEESQYEQRLIGNNFNKQVEEVLENFDLENAASWTSEDIDNEIDKRQSLIAKLQKRQACIIHKLMLNAERIRCVNRELRNEALEASRVNFNAEYMPGSQNM